MKQTSCFTHPDQPFSPAHPRGSYSIRCVACHHPLTTQHLESLADRLHGNASGVIEGRSVLRWGSMQTR